MAPPRKRGSSTRKPATPRKASQATEPATATPGDAAANAGRVDLEPGAGLPAPQPPKDAAEAAKQAEAEAAAQSSTGPDEAQASPVDQDGAAAPPADGEDGIPAAASPSTLTVVRDGVPTETEADS